MRNLFPLCLLILIACTGLQPKVSFSPTSNLPPRPKSPDCQFQVKATFPMNREFYEEVGLINIKPAALSDTLVAPENIEEFKNAIKHHVCMAGGDLVIGEVNGLGQYIFGIVFAKKESLSLK